MTRSALFALPLAAAAAVATTPARAVECFSIFDAQNLLVYQSVQPPLDLSRPIAGEMAARFPSRYLVIADTGTCPERTPAALPVSVASIAGGSPRARTRARADGQAATSRLP